MFGKVKVQDGKYMFDGKFHQAHPGTPIRDEDGYLCGVTKPRTVVHVHSYGNEAEFFQGLAEGELRVSYCDNESCPSYSKHFLPFRIHCPDCLEETDWFDGIDNAIDSAIVYSFMVT